MVGLSDRSLITRRGATEWLVLGTGHYLQGGGYRMVGLRDWSLITGRGATEWLVLGTGHYLQGGGL